MKIYAQIKFENQLNKTSLELNALVDSPSIFTVLPQHVALQLGFDITIDQTREFMLGDGSRKKLPIVGPLRIVFQERYCDTSAIVYGDEVLLGKIPIQMMALYIDVSNKLVMSQKPFLLPSSKLFPFSKHDSFFRL